MVQRYRQDLEIDQYVSKNVTELNYLGSLVTGINDMNGQISARINAGNRVFSVLRHFLSFKGLSRSVKL